MIAYSIVLIVMAVAPPLAFMYFIYWMDRHEPESMRTILAAMAIGAFSALPAIAIQLIFEPIYLFQLDGLTGAFFDSFLLVAPSEEFCKFIFIYLYLRRKHFYDEINDGIVYYGAGAIGFALFENIFYVFDYGFSTGLLRAFTAIPLHTFCGVVIGYHAGLARFSDQHHPGRTILRGLFIAYLTHASYNTLAMAENLLVVLFFPLVAFVYWLGFRIIKKGRLLSLAGTNWHKVESRLPFIAKPAVPVVNYNRSEVITDSSGRPYLPPRREKWKAFLGRILLVISALLWIIVFAGDEISGAGEFFELILGLIIITLIPVMIGVLLELSYRRRKRERIYIDSY